MESRIYIEDIDVVKMFLDDWLKVLDILEKEILKLELEQSDIELINNIDICIHNIKGGSSFIGLHSITRISREIEIILEAIRNFKLTISTELIDNLLQAIDFLKGYTATLHEMLKKEDALEENGVLYLELKNMQNEEQVIKSLKQNYENCEIKDKEDDKAQGQILEEDTSLQILQSEEFKRGLSEGMREQFLLENLDHIERIENDLLIRLDSNCDDKEAINEIFRAVHSIKGGTGIYLASMPSQGSTYVALKRFSEVAHTFESLLALVRDKGYKFEKDLVDLSLLVMDYCNSFIRAVEIDKFDNLSDNIILDKIKMQMLNIQNLPGTGTIGKSTEVITRQAVSQGTDMKSNVSATQSIRVNQEKLDKMMNMISELLIVKNSFMHLSSKLSLEYNLPELSKEVKQVGVNVNRISDDLQNSIMSIRMVEVKTVFQKMPRVIRDIAQSTGKKMELFMEGENTEIDKTIIEQISDPLVHLIRNSADHGIETTEERLINGKPETGKIILRAYNKNKYVFIEIEDDGKGIDAEILKEKAVEKGIITDGEAEKMNKNQLINLIFLPGFSMAKKITEVSGRGVGMDIVKSNITKINGKITIESEVDKGTKMIIQLPLTLAVSRGLVVEVKGESYIFPLEYIVETVKINRNSIHKFNGKFFTHLRGEVIGIQWLSKIFLMGENDGNSDNEELNVVILSTGEENYAIVVDKLKNEQEFVVKTLEGHLASIPGISGSTLLGNGKVVLIINPVDILQLVEE